MQLLMGNPIPATFQRGQNVIKMKMKLEKRVTSKPAIVSRRWESQEDVPLHAQDRVSRRWQGRERGSLHQVARRESCRGCQRRQPDP